MELAGTSTDWLFMTFLTGQLDRVVNKVDIFSFIMAKFYFLTI